jgi:hypothetical protein
MVMPTRRHIWNTPSDGIIYNVKAMRKDHTIFWWKYHGVKVEKANIYSTDSDGNIYQWCDPNHPPNVSPLLDTMGWKKIGEPFAHTDTDPYLDRAGMN